MAAKRLFIAICLPEDIRACLSQRIDALRRCASRGSFTHKDNLHLTLVFIGETDRMDDVIKILEETDCPPFSLTLSRGGKFSHNRGDICWVGIKESPALLSLQARLENRLKAAGFRIEDRPYRPHITLGRGIKTESFDNQVPELSFLVSEYMLMESTNENQRLVYKQICARHLSQK